jgi:hypothetical protein
MQIGWRTVVNAGLATVGVMVVAGGAIGGAPWWQLCLATLSFLAAILFWSLVGTP